MPEIKFLNYKNIPEVLELNADSSFSWPDSVIKKDLRENSNSEITYIGAFATNPEAPLLGYAVLGREKNFGSLMALLVNKNFRRLHIGSQLLMAVCDCAEYLNLKRVKLRVRPSNLVAIELYKRMKFKRESIRHKYYSDGEDAIIMSVKIPVLS